MEIEKLLPIGSIVRFKNAEKRFMIFGVKQSGTTEDGETMTDYIGVPYPEGNMGLEYQYMFNHENIDEIVYRGFEDSERDEFIDGLSQIFSKREN